MTTSGGIGTVQQATLAQPQTMQVYTQVVTPSGEIQQIPVGILI